MSKKSKAAVAKLHSELKSKETSLLNKIKNTTNEQVKSKLQYELCVVQDRLRRGAPNFGDNDDFWRY